MKEMSWGTLVLTIWCICALVDLAAILAGMKLGATEIKTHAVNGAFWLTFWWGAFKAVNHYVPKIEWAKVKEWHSDNF